MAWVAGAVVEVVLVVVFTAWLLHHYAMAGTHWSYLLVVYLAWLLGFAGTLLLPIDIGEAYEQTNSAGLLKSVWYTVYWATFALTWAVLPFMQEFYAAGEFTFRRRLLRSLRSNLRFYVIMLVAGLAFVVWMLSASSISIGDLPSFLLTVANTYGLCLIIFMLGYGLVEVPRKLWRLSMPAKALRRLEFRAVELDAALFDAKCALEEVTAEASAAKVVLPPATSPDAVELHAAMDVVTALSPPVSPRFKTRASPCTTDDVDMKYLASIHARLKVALGKFAKAQYRWDTLLNDIEHLQRVIEGTLPPSGASVAAATGESRWRVSCRNLRWYWHLYAAPAAYKFAAFVCMALSAVVLWSELMLPFGSRSLSLFGVVVNDAAHSGLRQLASLLPLVYICFCTYLSLFRLKLFGAVELSGNKQTDPYSLMFNAAYLCRLQFSLAFNYLTMLKLPRKTAYSRSVGDNMTLIPHLNAYLPMLLVLFAAATLFNVFERTLRLLGIDQQGSPRDGHPDDEETIRAGRVLTSKAGASAAAGAAPASATSVGDNQVELQLPTLRSHTSRAYRPPSADAEAAVPLTGADGGIRFTSGIPLRSSLDAFAVGASSPRGGVHTGGERRQGYGRLAK